MKTTFIFMAAFVLIFTLTGCLKITDKQPSCTTDSCQLGYSCYNSTCHQDCQINADCPEDMPKCRLMDDLTMKICVVGEDESAEKHNCQTKADCVISTRDPDGYATCVNKNWNEEWKNNPESKNYIWSCLSMGNETCGCINNKCQRTDSEKSCE